MARKQLNKNVVAVLTLLGFLIIIAASVMMLRQLQQRDPKYYTDLARQYADASEFKNAALFYWQAWEKSQNPRYLVYHGDMLLQEGSVREAIGSWRVALVNDPGLADAHHSLVEVLLDVARLYRQLDSWQAVHEAAEAFVGSSAEMTPEDEAFARHADALALINLGRRDPANVSLGEAQLRLASSLAPQEASYALDMTSYLSSRQRIDEADSLFEELLDRYAAPGADASRVRGAYAQYLARRNRFDEAIVSFQESLTLAGDDAEAQQSARLNYARFLTQRWARAARDGGEQVGVASFDQAESFLRLCIENDPDDFEAYLNLAVLYQSAQRAADVLAVCEERLSRGFSRKGVAADRHRVNAFSLMIYAADACVSEAVAAYQAGDHEKREGFLVQAEQFVIDARGEFPNHPRLFTQWARVKLARGSERAALEDLRKAEELYSGYDAVDWNNKLLLAQLHLSLGEAGAARTALEDVMEAARRERSSDAKFWLLYAQALYETEELDRALAISDQILAAEPNNTVALRIRAAVYERKGRFGEATGIVESLTDNEAVRPLRTAQQLSLEGQPAEAVAVLREALETLPGNVALVRAAVRELLNLDRGEEAHAIVESARNMNPEDITLKKLAVLTGTDRGSEERDAGLLEIINAQADGYQRALELLGFHWRRKQHAQALPVVNTALQHLDDKDTPLAQQATIEQHRALLSVKLTLGSLLNDDDVAGAARDAAIRYNVDGAHGQALLGQYHVQRKEFDLAIKALRGAIALQPTDTRSLTLLGQCLHHEGGLDEAQEMYERALRINPKAGSAHKGLAALSKQRGDMEAYQLALAEAERLIPLDAWVQGEVLARREADDPRAAIAQREEQLSDHPTDVSNVRRLAELYETVSDLEGADKHWTNLVALQPDDKDVIVAASRYYRRTDRPELSLAVVTQYADSRSHAADRANAHILLASHYLHTDDLDAVERALLTGADVEETLEVVQSLADFYRRRISRADKALPWQDKAVNKAREAHSPRLSSILGARISCLLDRRVGELEAARRGVRELLADFPDYWPGWILKSEAHARAGEMHEAIEALTSYLRRKPDDPHALYQRALHRRAEGQFSSAVADLETLRRSSPLALDLAPRLLLAKLHRQSGRDDLWVRELESLAQDAPTASVAIEALARAYVERGRFAEAERLVTGEINRGADSADTRWFFLRGSIAFKTDQPDRALEEYQRGAQLGGHAPEAVASVLEAFMAAGRFTDGIEYYDRFAPKEEARSTSALISRYARLLAASGDDALAVTQFRRAMALALGESSNAALMASGEVREAFDPVRAIALFTKNLPSGVLGRANDRILVRLYRYADRFDEADAILQALIKSADDDADRSELCAELGEVLQAAGANARARDAYEEALRYNADHWIALNNLAYLLSDAMHEHKLARPYAERAVALVDRPATLDTLGWIYVGLSQYAQAVAELSRAIRLDPGDPLTYYHLGEAYRRDGQLRRAGDILQDGLDLARIAGRVGLIDAFETSLSDVREGRSKP